MKLRDLIIAQMALKKLWETDKLSAKTAFLIGKFIKSISGDLEQFDQQRVRVKTQEELEELLDVEVNPPRLKLKLEEIDACGLSPAELMSIDWLIEDE